MKDKPAVLIAALFASGIVVAHLFSPPAFPFVLAILVLVGLVFAAAILWIVLRHDTLWTDTLLLLALVLAGALWYANSTQGHIDPQHVVSYAKRQESVELIGTVCKAPVLRREKVLLTVKSKEIRTDEGTSKIHGKVQVTVYSTECPIQYGDLIEVHGKLRLPRDRRNPGDFDYRQYLRAQGVYGIITCNDMHRIRLLATGGGAWLLRSLVYPARRFIIGTIDRCLGGDQSAFLKGLLVGARGEIAPELKDSFAKTGVVHVLAVSGLHVGFVVLIAMSVFGLARFNYRTRVILTILVIVVFVLLTEIRPPVLRATVMAAALLLSTVLKRATNVYNSLTVAALIVLIINPQELFQAGFQLSFAAVGSIIYLYNKLRALLGNRLLVAVERENAVTSFLLPLFFVSLAAQLGTLPITAYYFGRIPVISLVANLAVIPAVGCIVALGYTTSIFALVWWPLARLYAGANWLLLIALIGGVDWASRLPFAYIEYTRPRVMHIVAYYGVLFVLINLNNPKARRRGLILVLALCTIGVWAEAFRPRHQLEVTFLDVGQGDATLLRFPDEKTILVDTGPAGFHQNAGRWVIAPFLCHKGIDRVDALIITHPHMDHYGGAAYLLRHINITHVYDPGQTTASRAFQEYCHVLDSLGVKRQLLRRGNELSGFDRTLIFVLHPTASFVGGSTRAPLGFNNTSIVLQIIYGDTRLLLAADAERPAEESFLPYGRLLRSEILKVAHHGSNTSSSSFFLKAVQPRVGIVSVGEANRFGLPSPQALRRLEDNGVKILRTDRDAAVVYVTDSKEWQRIDWKGRRVSLAELLRF